MRSPNSPNEKTSRHPKVCNGSIVLKKAALSDADRPARWRERRLYRSGGRQERWGGDELGEFAQVLGGGGEEKLVSGAAGTA